MYAVIRSGGKQYRVSQGGSVRVEKLEGEVGSSVTLDDVLMVGEEGNVKIGVPTVDGAPTLQRRVRALPSSLLILPTTRRGQVGGPPPGGAGDGASKEIR